LDELMGRHRNAHPDNKPKDPHWSDPEVTMGLTWFLFTAPILAHRDDS